MRPLSDRPHLALDEGAVEEGQGGGEGEQAEADVEVARQHEARAAGVRLREDVEDERDPAEGGEADDEAQRQAAQCGW